MSKIKVAAAAVLAVVSLSACSLTLPVNATSNSVGSKVGTASATGFLQVLFFGGDASIRTAAKNGGISKISTVDLKKSDILGIVQTYECIVTGD
ncbi:MAG TPA: hypothetical protein DIS79_00670 [Bacteroidetes bacterium]|nr:hypothetical protein [Bacteroidota bacterium]HRK05853.1 TRL-like family protein [Chlorobiota bacterium]